jgi:hypothetical protein
VRSLKEDMYPWPGPDDADADAHNGSAEEIDEWF